VAIMSPVLRQRVGDILSAPFYNFCLQCGACVSDCPGHLYVEEFNPREIVLGVLLGREDELIRDDSVIWKCTNCYTCSERCPQDVQPIEIIIALKNIAMRDGKAPKVLDALLRTVRKTGRAFPLASQVTRRREEMGLCDIPLAPMDEIRKLEGSGDDGSPTKAKSQSAEGETSKGGEETS
jgi:heterodisulfide reductase subunit C